MSLGHTHTYRVMTPGGEHLARVSGRLRHAASGRADFPAVGDWVVLEPPASEGDARILAVLPRASRFSRRAAGDPTEEQIVAANIDVVFLVSGPITISISAASNAISSPRGRAAPRRSSCSTRPISSAIRAVHQRRRGDRAGRAGARGVGEASRHDGGVRAHLGAGRTAALLGSSGVGKSSIANALVG